MQQKSYSTLVILWWITAGALSLFPFEIDNIWITAIIWLIGGAILTVMIGRLSRAERRVNRLEHTRHKQAEYIALAVHELNTPLASLKGRLDMLLRENLADLNQSQRQQFKPVLVASDRLEALVLDLLDAARLDTGRFRLRWESVDLRPLLRECWQEVQPLLSNTARHRLNLGAGQLIVKGDPTRLRQIFRNLLSNAAKYAADGPVILTLKPAEHEFVITIRDRGLGLKPNELSRLGRRFWQSESPNRQPGTGLGLYIVQQLVRSHHGTVSYDSAGPDQGFTATIHLPRI